MRMMFIKTTRRCLLKLMLGINVVIKSQLKWKEGSKTVVSWSHVDIFLFEFFGMYRFQLSFSPSLLCTLTLLLLFLMYLCFGEIFWQRTLLFLEYYYLCWLESRKTLLLNDCAKSLFLLYVIDRDKFFFLHFIYVALLSMSVLQLLQFLLMW